jgi:hypothetical protein
MLFLFVVDGNHEKKTLAFDQQALGDVETRIIRQPMWALNENMKEQGETRVDVCATFVANVATTYVSRMEVELHKTIDMIEE